MRTLHLFAGAGGGLLADLILGHDPVCAVEWDAYCCQVLRERAADGWFPNLQVFEGDVRLFPASDWKGRVDCIHAGFPCQPHSVAGKRKGADDDRNLWPATAGIIGEIRPPWVFLENVPGLVSNGFIGTVLGDLARLGYDARWTVLGADQVGAPHRRDRWFCLANAEGGGDGRDGFWKTREEQSDRASQDDPNANGARFGAGGFSESKNVDIKSIRENVANAKFRAEGSAQKSEGGRDKHGIGNDGNAVGNDVGDCSWWSIEPDLGRTSDGIPFELDGGWHGKTEASYFQALRHLREGDGAEALRRATRGLPMFHAEAVLFAYLREYERGGRIPRTVLEGETTPRAILRKMRRNRDVGGASLGRKSLEQYAREYPDALRDLSQLVASRSETPWDSPLWESGVARVTQSSNSRVDQLKALGNAQVPLQAALAWTLLKGER